MKKNLIKAFLPIVGLLILALASFASADDVSREHWTAVSKDQALNGIIYPQVSPVKVGQFQRWMLDIRETTGAPVYPASIRIGGGMPAHGHGLPTQPQVTEYLGEGKYLIEGMKFNMAGQWVLLFVVSSEQVNSTLEFDLKLDY